MAQFWDQWITSR